MKSCIRVFCAVTVIPTEICFNMIYLPIMCVSYFLYHCAIMLCIAIKWICMHAACSSCFNRVYNVVLNKNTPVRIGYGWCKCAPLCYGRICVIRGVFPQSVCSAAGSWVHWVHACSVGGLQEGENLTSFDWIWKCSKLQSGMWNGSQVPCPTTATVCVCLYLYLKGSINVQQSACCKPAQNLYQMYLSWFEVYLHAAGMWE